MNPWGGVRGQAISAGILLAALAGLHSVTSAVLATAVAVAVLANAAYLYARYRHDLRGPDAVPTTSRRQLGDRLVEIEVLGVVVPALVIGAARLIDGSTWWPDGPYWPEIETFVAGVSVILAAIFSSSLWDWWHVLPRRDGVVIQPPCRTAGDPVWLNLTKTWFRHRLLAEIAFTLVPLIMGLVIGVLLIRNSHGIGWINKFVGFAFSVFALYFGYTRQRVLNGMTAVNRQVRFGLGDTISWEVVGHDAWSEAKISKQLPLWKFRIRIAVEKRSGKDAQETRGERAYVFDVALDEATTLTIDVDGDEPARTRTGHAPMRALLSDHGITERESTPYCAQQGRCLELHQNCARISAAAVADPA